MSGMHAEKALPRHLLIPVIADTLDITDSNEMPSIHNMLNKGFLSSSPCYYLKTKSFNY
jgi:hypothetical protein